MMELQVFVAYAPVVHRSDNRVGEGNNACNDAHGLCNLDHAAFFNSIDDIVGLLSL